MGSISTLGAPEATLLLNCNEGNCCIPLDHTDGSTLRDALNDRIMVSSYQAGAAYDRPHEAELMMSRSPIVSHRTCVPL